MGASPYYYFVDYEPSINTALQKLRDREFKAGRYNPVMGFPPFPINENSPAPGAEHDSIDDALEDSDADGTRSILDLDQVSSEVYDGDSDQYGMVAPLPGATLQEFFGTEQPSVDQLEEFLYDLIEDVARGMGIYVVGYQNGVPAKILFAGYSFD